MFAKIEWMGTLVVGSITYLVLFPTFLRLAMYATNRDLKPFTLGWIQSFNRISRRDTSRLAVQDVQSSTIWCKMNRY